MSDERAAARGHRAAGEYEELNFAFEAVEAAIVKALAETPVGADAKVLKLHMSLQNLSAVQAALRATIDNGRMADAVMAARNAVSAEGLTRL